MTKLNFGLLVRQRLRNTPSFANITNNSTAIAEDESQLIALKITEGVSSAEAGAKNTPNNVKTIMQESDSSRPYPKGKTLLLSGPVCKV